MQVLVRLAGVVFVAWLACVSGVGAQAARVIQLNGTDAMAFSMPTITAKPGEALKVVLKVTSNLPPEQLKHNFVLLKPDTDAMAFSGSICA